MAKGKKQDDIFSVVTKIVAGFGKVISPATLRAYLLSEIENSKQRLRHMLEWTRAHLKAENEFEAIGHNRQIIERHFDGFSRTMFGAVATVELAKAEQMIEHLHTIIADYATAVTKLTTDLSRTELKLSKLQEIKTDFSVVRQNTELRRERSELLDRVVGLEKQVRLLRQEANYPPKRKVDAVLCRVHPLCVEQAGHDNACRASNGTVLPAIPCQVRTNCILPAEHHTTSFCQRVDGYVYSSPAPQRFAYPE